MRFRASISLVVISGLALTARGARADEPIAASEPRLLNETAEVTTVADAFDQAEVDAASSFLIEA